MYYPSQRNSGGQGIAAKLLMDYLGGGSGDPGIVAGPDDQPYAPGPDGAYHPSAVTGPDNQPYVPKQGGDYYAQPNENEKQAAQAQARAALDWENSWNPIVPHEGGTPGGGGVKDFSAQGNSAGKGAATSALGGLLGGIASW